VRKNNHTRRKREKKTASLSIIAHTGVWVLREQLRCEASEVRPLFGSARCSVGPFIEPHLAQAGAALDQEVERGGVDLKVVVGEIEDLERLQLADKRRDGAEAALVEVEDSQGIHVPELCRERLVVVIVVSSSAATGSRYRRLLRPSFRIDRGQRVRVFAFPLKKTSATSL